MKWSEILKNRRVHYHRISSLIFLIIIISGALIKVIIPYLNNFIPQSYQIIVDNLILLICILTLLVHWYANRTIFPKVKSDKSSFVVAIVSENEKQNERISKDFVQNLKNNLSKYNLQNNYEIVVLHDALSLKIRRIITKSFGNLNDTKSLSKFNLLCSRMNARFIVYGDFITRNSPKNTHLLRLEALIRHRNPTPQIKNELQNSFKDMWEKEISFLEEEEINGFRLSGEQVFFASIYTLGLALFVDHNYLKCVEINEKLLKFIESNNTYEKYRPKILSLLASSYFIQSKIFLFIGKVEDFYHYRKKFIDLIPNEYDSLLVEAIYQVNKRDDPETALALIERASLLANGIDIWRYSKLYLLIKLERYEEALESLDALIDCSFEGEFDNINQVIRYNTICFEEDKNHIQSFFIIGCLIFKKLSNPPYAYEKLSIFIQLTNCNKSKWRILRNRAKEYLGDIEKIIGIAQ